MSNKKYLVGVVVRDILQQAIEKRLPVTLTTREGDNWQLYKSHFMAAQGNRLVLTLPVPDMQECHMEPAPGQEIALTFKKGYYKYIFAARVIARDTYTMDDQTTVPTMVVLMPVQLERIQRRAYNRAAVPTEVGIAVELRAGDGADQVVGQGRLFDVSAGGMGIFTDDSPTSKLQPDEQFRLSFTPPSESRCASGPIEVHVRLRHVTPDESELGWHLGFQVVGMEMSDEGLSVLRRLGRLANSFNRRNHFSPSRSGRD